MVFFCLFSAFFLRFVSSLEKRKAYLSGWWGWGVLFLDIFFFSGFCLGVIFECHCHYLVGEVFVYSGIYALGGR